MKVDMILNLINAALGVAGTIVVLACLFILGIIIKTLPKRIRGVVSAIVAFTFVATFMTGLVWQALYVFASRSMIYALFSLKLVSVSAVFGLLLFSVNRIQLVLMSGRRFLDGLLFEKGKYSCFVREKKSSSSSFELKVSSVLLQ